MSKPTGKLAFAYQSIAALEQKLAGARAELAALKAGQGEAVAYVSEESFSSNGTSDIITCNLPIGTVLYTAPPASADAVSVPRELLIRLFNYADRRMPVEIDDLYELRALLAQSESNGGEAMSGVRRYTAYDALIQVESNGKFVLASDYDRDMQALREDRDSQQRACIDVMAERDALRAQVEAMRALIDTPHTDEWFEAVRLEAAHQIKRWGTDHDAGKAPADWFWLLGYLGGKALAAAIAGNTEKAKHHTISSGAALLNWFRALTGDNDEMRPGIDIALQAKP